MAGTGATNTGDKVTLALVVQKLDALSNLYDKGHKEVMDEVRAIKDNVHTLDNEQCVQAEKVKTVEEEVDKLRSRDTVWSIGNSVGAAIAGLLALTKS